MYRSGMTRILRSIRILSAAGVVGPLAASAIICEQNNFMNTGHIQVHPGQSKVAHQQGAALALV
jgi:hypothetical protein